MYKLLIVDDEEKIREVIREYAEFNDYQVMEACDGMEAVVGTINLDYRSLYHHFECAAYLYGADCIAGIEADFQATEGKCRRVTRETIRTEKTSTKLLGCLLKIIAPLL